MNLQPEELSSPLPLEVINSNTCVYTPCYCEENVWKLVETIQKRSEETLNNCYVVFVSNNRTFVPLWKQKASTKEDGFVIWDYHVFLVYEGQNDNWVYDLDSQLPFPCKFVKYCKETFRSDNDIKPEFHRFLRVIRGSDYIKYFASDRRHMRHEDGSWLQPPPTYSPISTKDSVHNLPEYISMSNKSDYLIVSHYGTLRFLV